MIRNQLSRVPEHYGNNVALAFFFTWLGFVLAHIFSRVPIYCAWAF